MRDKFTSAYYRAMEAGWDSDKHPRGKDGKFGGGGGGGGGKGKGDHQGSIPRRADGTLGRSGKVENPVLAKQLKTNPLKVGDRVTVVDSMGKTVSGRVTSNGSINHAQYGKTGYSSVHTDTGSTAFYADEEIKSRSAPAAPQPSSKPPSLPTHYKPEPHKPSSEPDATSARYKGKQPWEKKKKEAQSPQVVAGQLPTAKGKVDKAAADVAQAKLDVRNVPAVQKPAAQLRADQMHNVLVRRTQALAKLATQDPMAGVQKKTAPQMKTFAKTAGYEHPAAFAALGQALQNRLKKPVVVEADGGAGFPQVQRAMESQATSSPFSIRFRESTTFRETKVNESNPTASPSRFASIIIQEGMGNFRDGFFYTKEALASAVEIFEGKKIYADHPTKIEEEIIPERSVRDILGHFENVRVTEAEDGHAVLESDLVILEGSEFDWARGLMRHAVEYSKKFPDRDFVGLSINANGQAEQRGIEDFMSAGVPESCRAKLQAAMESGIEQVRVVSKLTDAISCDLVTEAGAGGRLTKMIEGDLMSKKIVKESEQHPAVAAGAQTKGVTIEAEKHDDAAQDKALIAQMLKKHSGSEEEPTEEDIGMAKECMEMCKEMGMEGEEAEKHAMSGMKMMKKVAEKYAPKEEAKEGEEVAPAEEKKEEAAAPMESATPHSDSLALRGQLAAANQKLRRFELNEYLDKKLSESGEERRVTNLFREGIKVEELRSSKDIDAKWAQFIEGYNLGRQSAGLGEVVLSVQKRGEAPKSGLDLSSCVL